MDDDKLQSGGDSVNDESDDEFDKNSEEDNSSDSIDICEVLFCDDDYCLCTCVYNLIYFVFLFRIQIAQMLILILL